MAFRNILAGVALALAGYLAFVNHQYAGELNATRKMVSVHVERAKRAEGDAARMELKVEALKDSAAHAEKRAQQQAAQAQVLRAQLKQAATVHDSLKVKTQEAESWKNAYEAQIHATVALRGAVDTSQTASKEVREASTNLQGSATELVKATRRGWLPKVGFGAAAGVNPQGRPDAVIGVTLSW